MVKAIRIHRTGGPEVLRVEDIELPAPGPGEVVLRQSFVGLNFIDCYQRAGLYEVPLPAVLGSEAAGVVERVGPDVTLVREGDRVAYASGGIGAYAEARVVRAEHLVRLPDYVSDETAAALLLKGLTANYLIRHTYPVKAGDIVLFHAAAGGVGLIACRWLAALGARVIGTAGTDEKAQLARENGCHDVIVYTREDFVERVRELTHGRGVDVVYDSVGKLTVPKSLDCLTRRGMLVSFGNASGKPDPIDVLTLSRKGSLFLTRPTLGHYIATREELEAGARALFQAYEAGHVAVHVGQRFPLEHAAEAHRALESRATVGSTLLVV
jgi:NADPH2:quinone reductase